MREIAAEAGYSPRLTYRYFKNKEELVLRLYQNLCTELEEYVRKLPPGSLPERFHATIANNLELMALIEQHLALFLVRPSILTQAQECSVRAQRIFVAMPETPT